jgi:hypothetical protein
MHRALRVLRPSSTTISSTTATATAVHITPLLSCAAARVVSVASTTSSRHMSAAAAPTRTVPTTLAEKKGIITHQT